MPLRMPAAADPELMQEWSRVLTYGQKLLESIDRLDDLGGCCRVAAVARWSPESHDAASGSSG